jgi:hypothetical protein
MDNEVKGGRGSKSRVSPIAGDRVTPQYTNAKREIRRGAEREVGDPGRKPGEDSGVEQRQRGRPTEPIKVIQSDSRIESMQQPAICE